MANYVMSDIHGEYDMFQELLKQIELKKTDTLYVLGDVLDRGPHPIKTILKLMELQNCICITGNHEVMAQECLEFLMGDVLNISLDKMDEKMLNNLVTWQYNGSKTTIHEFRKQSLETQKAIIEFIKGFSNYEEVTVGNKNFLLVHAGLDNFKPEKDIQEYSLHDLVWGQADYERMYYRDKYLVTGHTPTQSIKENPVPGAIYKHNNHIAIDCGAPYQGGRLAAYCLDSGQEFYSSSNGDVFSD